MANAGTIVAHLFKLFVTLVCMRYSESSYKIFTKENDWVARAFQILLAHSALGLFIFGTTSTLPGKRLLHDIYESFSNIVEIVPFGLLADEIALRCRVHEALRQLLLATLGFLPVVHELIRKKNRTRMQYLTNLVIIIQLFTIVVACLRKGYWSIVSFAVSYVIHRYYLEDLCDRLDVPYVDIAQYSLSFVESFALVTIKEL